MNETMIKYQTTWLIDVRRRSQRKAFVVTLRTEMSRPKTYANTSCYSDDSPAICYGHHTV